MSDSLVVWWVLVDGAAEDRWRAAMGQADVDAWCAAHGWDSNHVVSGSVTVSAFRDGRVEVMADLYERDENGMAIWHNGDVLRRTVYAPYSRSLPEGIAPVRRAS